MLSLIRTSKKQQPISTKIGKASKLQKISICKIANHKLIAEKNLDTKSLVSQEVNTSLRISRDRCRSLISGDSQNSKQSTLIPVGELHKTYKFAVRSPRENNSEFIVPICNVSAQLTSLKTTDLESIPPEEDVPANKESLALKFSRYLPSRSLHHGPSLKIQLGCCGQISCQPRADEPLSPMKTSSCMDAADAGLSSPIYDLDGCSECEKPEQAQSLVGELLAVSAQIYEDQYTSWAQEDKKLNESPVLSSRQRDHLLIGPISRNSNRSEIKTFESDMRVPVNWVAGKNSKNPSRIVLPARLDKVRASTLTLEQVTDKVPSFHFGCSPMLSSSRCHKIASPKAPLERDFLQEDTSRPNSANPLPLDTNLALGALLIPFLAVRAIRTQKADRR